MNKPLTAFVIALLPVMTIFAQAPEADSIRLSDETRERCLRILRDGLASDDFWPSMHAAEALTYSDFGNEMLAARRKKRVTDRALNDQERCGLAREAVRAGDRSKIDDV